MASLQTKTPLPGRLLSLDVLRGFIMVLLAIESTGIYDHLFEHSAGTPFNHFIIQFTHHPWHGLHFWDLVQPSFMFMAGVAMAFSLNKQWENGVTWMATFKKTLKRCGWLFFWGVLDYAVRPKGLSFELWDVLTQLSFTTLIAFLIFRWSGAAQLGICAGLLLLTEVLYRFTHVPGFDQPFTDQHNFGNYIDVILMHKINHGGWVAINCIPTAVHTIAGALAGKLLLNGGHKNKLRTLLLSAAVCFIIGYGLDLFGVTPIIKRIATSSFTLVSLGYALVFLSLAYWWIDVKGHRKNLTFFIVIGMNSIFIYLFFEIVGSRWFNGYVSAITDGVMGWFNAGELLKMIVSATCIFGLEWGICYFMYRKKVFLKV